MLILDVFSLRWLSISKASVTMNPPPCPAWRWRRIVGDWTTDLVRKVSASGWSNSGVHWWIEKALGVSTNGGTPSHHLFENRIFHYLYPFWGTPHLWNHHFIPFQSFLVLFAQFAGWEGAKFAQPSTIASYFIHFEKDRIYWCFPKDRKRMKKERQLDQHT